VRDEIFRLQNEARAALPDDPSPDDPWVVVILDALGALTLSEPDDPSHPWARGGLLAQLGRHLEAADDYVLAARLFDAEARTGGGLTGDEAEWASSARAHAAESLALGGHPVAALALLRTLDIEDRQRVQDLAESRLRELERLAAG
jgi:hypothetical protein